MKITVPKTQIITGGTLENWYTDILRLYENVSRKHLNGNILIESNDIELSIAEINNILTLAPDPGEVEEYLMAIRADKELLTENVPLGLPNAETFTNLNRTFENWFDSNCELWANAVDIASATQIYILSNPLGTTKEQYLKGSEIAALYFAFGGQTPTVSNRHLLPRTISQFNTEVTTGWTRIN